MINFFKKLMNKITINGITQQVSGKNIVVEDVMNGSKVIVKVDGVIVHQSDSHSLKITFEGDLATLRATHANVSGNVMGDVDGTNIKISGDVMGDVDGTNVTANEIKGRVDAINVNVKNNLSI